MQRFDSGGVGIAFLDSPVPDARGVPVVMVHGFASTHAVNWVNTGWVKAVNEAGRRVVALDNRGHGASDKPHHPAAYETPVMAEDVRGLLDHLGIARADVVGYSMGARITAFLALGHPDRVRSIVLGGLGRHLLDKAGLPPAIAEALEARHVDDVIDPTQRMFRKFADANGADRVALAACVRGSRQEMTQAQAGRIACPALVAVGTRDPIAGAPEPLAAVLPQGRTLPIPDRDHNLAVGDKVFKAGALSLFTELDGAAR